jgi:hypothetical protein
MTAPPVYDWRSGRWISRLEVAESFLREVLREPLPAEAVRELAAARGIAFMTLRRAKLPLVESVKAPEWQGRWIWRLRPPRPRRKRRGVAFRRGLAAARPAPSRSDVALESAQEILRRADELLRARGRLL